ncbi:hypothetical protein RCL1_001366 [Eukaryota sp. TZLM3-RCL]
MSFSEVITISSDDECEVIAVNRLSPSVVPNSSKTLLLKKSKSSSTVQLKLKGPTAVQTPTPPNQAPVCSYCLEALTSPSSFPLVVPSIDSMKLVITPCGHVYHLNCLTTSTQGSSKKSTPCGICRTNVVLSKCKPVYFQ